MNIFSSSDPDKKIQSYLCKSKYQDAMIECEDVGNTYYRSKDYHRAFNYYIKAFEIMMDYNLLCEQGVNDNINYTGGFHSSLKCAIELYDYDDYKLNKWIDKQNHYRVEIDQQIFNTITYVVKDSNLSNNKKKICINFIYKKMEDKGLLLGEIKIWMSFPI